VAREEEADVAMTAEETDSSGGEDRQSRERAAGT
jgi:hypothetical protein